MTLLSPVRRLMKLFHPEGIPFPGSSFYNLISRTDIFRRLYDLVARDISSYCSEGNILDIGTGPAWLLIKLYERSPKLRLTGVDISSSMVTKALNNVARVGLSDVIKIKAGDASHLPCTDESFDAVVSTGSMHHWKNPSASLNEIYRVIKPGGYALMYDLVSDTPGTILKESVHEFGRLKLLMFWIHSFEEPFYTQHNFELLASSTFFKEGKTKFVGLLCCLILRK